MIIWADLIFVMEKRHLQRISERFPAEVDGKEIITLGIPDDYQYMDKDLIEELISKVSDYL